MDHLRQELLEGFRTWLRSWGAAETTIERRLLVVGKVLTGHPDPAGITADDIVRFLATPGYSAWTRTTYFGHLSSFFKWAAETGAVPANPMLGVRRPSTPRNRPRPLTGAEERLTVGLAEGRLLTWLRLGLLQGLRAHETAKLRGEHVTREHLYVRGKGGRDHVLPTHPLVWELAAVHPARGWWFPSDTGGHVLGSTVTQRTTRHFRRLGVEGSYHRCRHTYGTNLLRAGVNLRVVQELMRHSSLATTAAYLGVEDDERQAAIRLLAA